MIFSLPCPFPSCPLLSVTACWHCHYCTCITVIWLFIWLKTKVLKGLGPYLARTWQYLAQSRHSESISWTLFPWIENGIWHYSGHCVNWHNGVEEISWSNCRQWSGSAGRLGRGEVTPSGLQGCAPGLYQWNLQEAGLNREKSRLPRASHAPERLSKEHRAVQLLIVPGPWRAQVWEGRPDTHRAPVLRSESGSDATGNGPSSRAQSLRFGTDELCHFSEGITAVPLPGSKQPPCPV